MALKDREGTTILVEDNLGRKFTDTMGWNKNVGGVYAKLCEELNRGELACCEKSRDIGLWFNGWAVSVL